MPRCLDPQSRVEGLVEKAYQRVKAVALTVTPSVGFRDSTDRDQHNQRPSNTSPVCPHGSPQTNHGHESSGEPPQLPPIGTSTLRNFNDSNPQAINPFPFRSRNSRNTSGKSSSKTSSYVPINQQSSPSSQSVPSFQQTGVNEGDVNDTVINICAVHRNNTISRLATSPVITPPVNTPIPSSSKYQLQDPPSSIGRQPIGDSSSSTSMAGKSHSTPSSSRFNGWSQPSEDYNNQPMDSGDDAMVYNDPPPSFDDALLDDVPVGGSRSEVSLANTITIGFSSTCHR